MVAKFSFKIKNIIRLFNPQVWVAVAVTFLGLVVLINFVNLTPEVTDDFFFSSEDPQFQYEKKISKLFVRNDGMIVISATGDIGSLLYREKVYDLSESLLGLDGVSGVSSLTHGPNDFEDALKSPMWKRMILSDDMKSTNLIVLLDEAVSDLMVPFIEDMVYQFESQDFKLRVSGMPYIVELIRRSLLRDIKVFSVIAILIFGLIIFTLFRSKGAFFGTLITCLNACIWTFMLTDFLGIPIGILTANLGTIICILTLSHIIFLTYSWKSACYAPTPLIPRPKLWGFPFKLLFKKKQDDSSLPSFTPVIEALILTFPPSFWGMFTTLLGFISLIFVQAKPLRDLGASGAIGTLMAIVAAYTIYPAFLKASSVEKQKKIAQSKPKIEVIQGNIYGFLNRKRSYIITIIVAISIMVIPGLFSIDSDPSLLSYFAKGSEIRNGLGYIDRNGGSSPLIIVVKSQSDEKIVSQKTFKDLWRLQEVLEQHRSVGSVLSLPVLLAQARKTPLGFLVSVISMDALISVLKKPEYDAVAKSFISSDGKYGLFMLRMTESYRVRSRLEIIDEIKELVYAQGFAPEIIGGIYSLQGHLAKLVAVSLVNGLGKLVLLFAVIGLMISRSFRITLALTLSVAILPISILGLIGLYRIPLDIISAPASNIAIAIGIDAMIHMIKAFQRLKDWDKVKDHLWQPILTAMFVISIGFGIFSFSSFPPTQRFGLAILVGSIFASLTALFIMPFLVKKIKIGKLPKSETMLKQGI
ncbi:MAG: MMPL family transporter [Candidatus Kaelpia aquatica]|nr:MMPL family transporter [Candidatus Kaelpia aquatica]